MNICFASVNHFDYFDFVDVIERSTSTVLLLNVSAMKMRCWHKREWLSGSTLDCSTMILVCILVTIDVFQLQTTLMRGGGEWHSEVGKESNRSIVS